MQYHFTRVFVKAFKDNGIMKKSQASLLFIFVTVTLEMIGIGLIIPSLPGIMRRFVSDPSQVSAYYGYFVSLYALMQFIASPFLGALSDRFGRRPVLLVSLFCAGLDYLLMAFAPNLGILFVGRIISGLTGACITVAMAYIADISTDENRSKNYGMVGAAFGLGFIIGPAIGGLLGQYGPQYPFVAAAILNLVNFCFGIFVLPESFLPDKRRSFSWKKANPFISLTKLFNMPAILLLAAVHFLFMLSGNTHPSVWVLYTEFRYGWTTGQVGASLALVGILSAIAQGWLTGIMVKKFGEYRVVLWGSLGFAAEFVALGLSNQGWMIYPILIMFSVFWTAQPALQGLISKEIPANEQGEMQGSLVSLTSLTAIINPLITTQLFAIFSSPSAPIFAPGAPYFFAALVALISWILLIYSHKKTA
jgi:DHA1 family tetracycline resistance protein-like MFS transporter